MAPANPPILAKRNRLLRGPSGHLLLPRHSFSPPPLPHVVRSLKLLHLFATLPSRSLIQFYLLLSSAIVVGIEDPLLQMVRQYNPDVPLAVVGHQVSARCDRWKPPDLPDVPDA